jgi:transposase-like protein
MDKIKSLVEARKEFATQEACEAYLAKMRWPQGVNCPRCGSQDVTYMASRRQWQCECRYQFSVTAGTVFHKTHIDLPRWLMAVWLVCHSPKGVSSKQIQRELGVTYKTAWYMTLRIRRAIQHDLRMGPRGQKRDEKLLEEVFRLCCRYAGQTPGQAVFVPEIQQALAGNIGWSRMSGLEVAADGGGVAKVIELVLPTLLIFQVYFLSKAVDASLVTESL